MSVFACILTQASFFVIATIMGILAKRAVERGEYEAALKYNQHEMITAFMPVGIAFFYWIFG